MSYVTLYDSFSDEATGIEASDKDRVVLVGGLPQPRNRSVLPQHKPSSQCLRNVTQISRGSSNYPRTTRVDQRFNQYRDRGGKTSNSYSLDLMGTSEHNSSTDTDAQNLRMVCEKSAHGDTQNLRMNNLGINNLGKETNISSSNDEGDYYFDQLWSLYPRKVGKGQARKAFKTASKKIDFYDLLPKLMDYVNTLEGKDKQFMPHLATWLNGERWTDEVEQ